METETPAPVVEGEVKDCPRCGAPWFEPGEGCGIPCRGCGFHDCSE